MATNENMHTIYHTKTLMEPPQSHVAVHVPLIMQYVHSHALGTVPCKLRNPAETPEGRKNATWSSRGHIGPTRQPQPPHMMPYPCRKACNHTSRIIETTAFQTQPCTCIVTYGRQYTYFWPPLYVCMYVCVCVRGCVRARRRIGR